MPETTVASTPSLLQRTRQIRDWMLANAPDGLCGEAVRAHLTGFKTDEQIDGWIALYRDAVVPAIPDFAGSVGVDFGCWSGFGTSILASFGAARVFCVEANARTMAYGKRWASQFDLDALRFAWNAGGVIPLADETVDWVYVNQVFCNMRPDGFDQAVGEISRVLKSGGRLVFCDSNNPHCSATIERLSRVYRTRELGSGDSTHPDGVIFHERVKRVRELIPAIRDESAQRLARQTCYLGGDELDRTIIVWRDHGIEPASPFLGGWQKAPVHAPTGMAAGNVTDPFDLAARFRKSGLRVSINTSATPGPSDPAELLDQISMSQSFYILGEKR